MEATVDTVTIFCSSKELTVQIVSMPSLLDVMPKCCTVAMFVIVELQIMFSPYCVGVFMVCLCTSGIAVLPSD
jgi:hypothetical protein